jgi:hemerythrin-like domain-containing protein
MLPIGPLMIEHRLIERMLKGAKQALERAVKEKKLDPVFVETVTDFVKAYADRCHHGKEEDILFRELAKKDLSAEQRKIMQELMDEHQLGRENTGRLVDANERYRKDEEGALSTILECLGSLVEFYPKHIEKEDKHFFMPIMALFSKEEKDAMLREGYEFDSKLIHREYQDIVMKAEQFIRL